MPDEAMPDGTEPSVTGIVDALRATQDSKVLLQGTDTHRLMCVYTELAIAAGVTHRTPAQVWRSCRAACRVSRGRSFWQPSYTRRRTSQSCKLYGLRRLGCATHSCCSE